MRVSAVVFSEANSRILARSHLRNYDFVLNDLIHVATHI